LRLYVHAVVIIAIFVAVVIAVAPRSILAVLDVHLISIVGAEPQLLFKARQPAGCSKKKQRP
jgi:hypothetical protein